MANDILLVSSLKSKRMFKVEELLKKSYIENVDSLLSSLFKLFNKEIDHIRSTTVFSDKDYLQKIFSYINIIIKNEDCDLLKIKTYLDLSSSKIEKKLKESSNPKYKKFLNKMYMEIEKSRLYIVDKKQKEELFVCLSSDDLIEDTFNKLNTFILTLTPSKSFNPNYEEYENKYRIIFKNILSDKNVDIEEVITRLKESITKIEDKKILIKGVAHSRRVRRFLNYLKVLFTDIINQYKKVDNKSYKYSNPLEVIN